MSIFSTILDKLGLHKPATPAAPAAPAAAPKPAPYSPISSPVVPSTPPSAQPAPSNVSPIHFGPPAQAAVPAPMAMVDVVSHLDSLAKASPIKLSWRTSINDLLALLGLPHTAKAIKDLAVELGCPEKEMSDSYSRNVWTHQTLLKKIAENGGNIPQNLLN